MNSTPHRRCVSLIISLILVGFLASWGKTFPWALEMSQMDKDTATLSPTACQHQDDTNTITL